MRRRRLLIVGGGCYGSHFARSLARARRRGGEPFDVWILDRKANCPAGAELQGAEDRLIAAEWEEFLASYLQGTAEERARRHLDLLVPSPLAPHLFAGWLAARWQALGVESTPFPGLPDLPYCKESPLGGVAISHAAWRCPTHCVEPGLCPATRQRRDWELARSLLRYTRSTRLSCDLPLVGPLLAQCVAWREGVGVMALRDWTAAAARADRALRGRGGLVLAATVSSCHGIAHLLRVGAARGGSGAGAVRPPPSRT